MHTDTERATDRFARLVIAAFALLVVALALVGAAT
jgi:hypothetical protein